MASKEMDLKPVVHITSGAVGPPGKRVFYLQARKGEQVVTLIVEKTQLESLAIGVEHFLEDLQERFPDLSVATGDYIEINGSPNISLSGSPEIPGGQATCALAVNMIPRVMTASPGLHTMAELPVPAAVLGDARKIVSRYQQEKHHG